MTTPVPDFNQRLQSNDPAAVALYSATIKYRLLDLGAPKKTQIAFCTRCDELRDCLSGADICGCTEEQLQAWLEGKRDLTPADAHATVAPGLLAGDPPEEER